MTLQIWCVRWDYDDEQMTTQKQKRFVVKKEAFKFYRKHLKIKNTRNYYIIKEYYKRDGYKLLTQPECIELEFGGEL